MRIRDLAWAFHVVAVLALVTASAFIPSTFPTVPPYVLLIFILAILVTASGYTLGKSKDD